MMSMRDPSVKVRVPMFMHFRLGNRFNSAVLNRRKFCAGLGQHIGVVADDDFGGINLIDHFDQPLFTVNIESVRGFI